MADVNKCMHGDARFPGDDSGEQITMKAAINISAKEMVCHFVSSTDYLWSSITTGSLGAGQGSATHDFDEGAYKIAGVTPDTVTSGNEHAVTMHGVVDTNFNVTANSTKVYIMLASAGSPGDAAATSTAPGTGLICGVSLEVADPGLIFLFPWRI